MQYTVIIQGSNKQLCEDVEAALADGWTLQGGVSVSNYAIANKVTVWFSQALVKESAENANENDFVKTYENSRDGIVSARDEMTETDLAR